MNNFRKDFEIPKEITGILSSNGRDMGGISPALEVYYEELNRRVLWCETEIDPGPLDGFPDQEHVKSTVELIKLIERFNYEDKNIPTEERTPIKLKINTPGGDVQTAAALCDAIRLSKTPVYTIAVGGAMSAGAHILAAGKKRFAYPSATILIHSGSVFMGGDVEKAESMRRYFTAMSDKFNNQLLAETKIDPKMLKKKGAFDWYISAEEALEYGIIDKIVDDLDEIV